MRTLLAVVITFLWVCEVSPWEKASQCRDKENERPKDCITHKAKALESYKTVEDFDRCAPYFMPNVSRQYYLAAAGRCVTYRENKIAYQRLRILPKILRDVSKMNMRTTVLNQSIAFPVGASPTALQNLASPLGELDTIRATYEAGTVMILSSFAGTLLEDVAKAAPRALKWMQLYILEDRRYSLNLIQRAEASGYKAIVLTVDRPLGANSASGESIFVNNPANATYVNILFLNGTAPAPTNRFLTFKDITWLKRNTRLPIVAKGVLTPEDAVRAVLLGASAIMVSNHGGRALDYSPPTIDVLQGIVDAVRRRCPWAEVYVDGGVRNGYDVFKALARGARAVFIGRPIAWGLAAGGQAGLSKVFQILKRELNETMVLAGTPSVRHIERRMVTEDGKYVIGKH